MARQHRASARLLSTNSVSVNFGTFTKLSRKSNKYHLQVAWSFFYGAVCIISSPSENRVVLPPPIHTTNQANNKSAAAFIWTRHISNNHSNMACKQSQHCLAPTGFCFCRVSGTSSRHTLDSPVTLTSLRTRKPSGVRCQSRDMRAVHRTSTRITQSRLSVQDRNGGTFLPCNPFLAWTHVRL